MRRMTEHDIYAREETEEERQANLDEINEILAWQKADADARQARIEAYEAKQILDDTSQWRKEFGMDMPVMINGKPHFSGVN